MPKGEPRTDLKKLMKALDALMPVLDDVPTMTRERINTMLRLSYLCGYEAHRAEVLHIQGVLNEGS